MSPENIKSLARARSYSEKNSPENQEFLHHGMLVTTLDVNSLPPTEDLKTKVSQTNCWYIPDMRTCMSTIKKRVNPMSPEDS